MRDIRGLSNLFRVPLGLSNSTTALALKNALVHVCGMKHLTLVILLALAPLSWGEEELVLYCVGETMTDFKGDVVVRLDTNETVAFKDWKHSFKIGDKSVQSSMEFVPSRPIAMKTKDFVYATSGSATWAIAKDSSDSKKYHLYNTYFSESVYSILYARCTAF